MDARVTDVTLTDEDRAALKRIYEVALEVQDACNASGLIRTLARYTELLWKEAHAFGLGTDHVNRHPVMLWFLDKLEDLAGRPESMELSRAYNVLADVRDGQLVIGSDEHKKRMENK